MNFDDYRAAKGVNISYLKGFAKSPAHALIQRPQTAAMALGTAFHTLILEPEKFGHEYAVAPTCDRRTKEGKAIFADFESTNTGKTILKAEDMESLEGMSKAVWGHSQASAAVSCGPVEQSLSWEIDGVACKGRPDVYAAEVDLIIDLKKTKDASPKAFQSQTINLLYHWQAAFYCDAHKALTGRDATFSFVCVEDTEPYGVACYTVSPRLLELGRAGYLKAMAQHVECAKNGIFPAYPEGFMVLEPPRWALTETEIEIEGDDFS